MDPIENRETNLRKPHGGLWTSTYTRDDKMSAWVSWSAREKFYRTNEQAWRLQPTNGTELLVIDNRQDLADIVDVFTREPIYETANDGPGIDYEAASDFYDGIWLTADGQNKTRMHSKGTVTLYGWDVESTLWFNWRFAAIEPLGLIAWTEHPSHR
jgi:hypothetical protein